jgi:uncharacterized protein YgiM (DUF1202 family)
VNSRIIFSILIVLLLSTSCNTPSGEEESVTTPTVFGSATALPTTLTPAPSKTPLPPPPQPTIAPVEGTASTQINVRAEPSTASNILGMITANTKVEILGKDPSGNWYQINYSQGVDGKGWVTAKYVTTATGTEVPVIGVDKSNPNNGNVAVVQQQINVRSGPGTSFNSLGTLNAQDVVNLIGKDANGAWLQIEFPQGSGPDSKGWVNAAFVQAKGVENIPIFTEAGEAIGTGTPTGIPFTPTPTVIPAWVDNDSQNNPIASVTFEPLGTHTLIYSGDVSAPEGDSQDWIQFTSYNDSVLAKIECNDHNNLQASLFENGQPTSFELACDNLFKEIKIKPGVVYFIQLQVQQPSSGLQYIHYTITIKTGQ